MSSRWDILLQRIVEEYRRFPNNFLRQRTIRRTMHPNCQSLAEFYYTEMRKNVFFRESILPKIRDSSIGMPYKFHQLPRCSPLTIQHVYHLYIIKQKLQVFVPTEKISHVVEIGGGYGNLCRIIKNFGYQGRYLIADFPAMLKLQREYLSRNLITDVEFLTLDMTRLAPKDRDTSILFAAFSVNEMPIETRKAIEPYYENYNYLFFVHNAFFDDIDNVEYFTDLRRRLQPKFDIEHVKDEFKTSWFMTCKRKQQ